MANQWFRFYSESLRDRKIERICNVTKLNKATLLGIWVTLLSLANDSPEPGILLLVDNIPLNVEDFGYEVGMTEQEIAPIIKQFIKMDMVAVDGNVYYIKNWSKRQFKSDNSTERVQEYRKRKETESEQEETVDVTLPERFSIAPETETETETEQNTGEKASPDAGDTKNKVREALEIKFSTVTGLQRPKTSTQSQKKSAGSLWWNPLREIAELCEWDTARAIKLIDASVDKLKGGGLTIASPKSILNTARAFVADGGAGGHLQLF